MLLQTLFSRELVALGIRELFAHGLRSLLTMLGMIFGVGAVICMLSIGEGASAEQLESIRLLGSENIILRSVEPSSDQTGGDGKSSQSLKQYGLTEADVERLAALPDVSAIVRMRHVADFVVRGSNRVEATVLGTTHNFFDVVHLRLARGRGLTDVDELHRKKVCVVGADVARNVFRGEDPIGNLLTVSSVSTGAIPYEVVGVLGDVLTAGKPEKGLASRNPNRDVYIPFATADLRYGTLKMKVTRSSRDARQVEYSDVYVRAADTDGVLGLSELVKRVMMHGHKQTDYEVTVPLELLRQAEASKRIWQTVLGSIAGISLLVGGIGIMNIMLASVTERTREIGIRRALGAKRYHITAQFLLETVILSVSGGIIGIVVGVGFAVVASYVLGWQTIIPIWGVLLSFAVSALVGVSFGLYPARAAAKLDPIEALRYQ